jgi:hypothetical protein
VSWRNSSLLLKNVKNDKSGKKQILFLSENWTVFWLRKKEKDFFCFKLRELLKCHYFVCNMCRRMFPISSVNLLQPGLSKTLPRRVPARSSLQRSRTRWIREEFFLYSGWNVLLNTANIRESNFSVTGRSLQPHTHGFLGILRIFYW